jgi:hypothetical protein
MNRLPDKTAGSEHKATTERPDTKELALVFLLFFAAALTALFFCNFNSPFYRYSAKPDANVYMGVARALRHGLMPYRDVFDHNGLLLYLINYVATLLSPENLTGIYLILSVFLATFLWYGYRIARMLLAKLPALVATFPLLIFSVGNRSFFQGGGSTEEYLMPCLMACLFYLVRSFQFAEKYDELTSRRFFLDSMATGFICGVMLWIKYTSIPSVGVAFLAFYIYLFTNKRGSTALRSLLGVFLGALFISAPCLIFLWKNDLFKEMWSAYITFNISYNKSNLTALHTMRNLPFLYAAIPFMIVSLLGLPFLYVQQKSKIFSKAGFLVVLLYTGICIVSVVVFGMYFRYYFLAILHPLIFTTTACIQFLLSRRITRKIFGSSKAVLNIFGVFLILLCLSLTVFSAVQDWKIWSVFAPKTEMEYYADAANEYWAINGDGSAPRMIFFMSMDRGMLQLCDTYPQHQFYYKPNTGLETGISIGKEQLRYIEEGTVDFIVADDGDIFTDFFSNTNTPYEPLFIPGVFVEERKQYYIVYVKVDCEDDS